MRVLRRALVVTAMPVAACLAHVAVQDSRAPATVAADDGGFDAALPDVPDGTYLVPVTPAACAGPHGYLSILCLPGCDEVYIDGEPVGPSPIFKRCAPLGLHRIHLASHNPRGDKVVTKVVQAGSVAMVRESVGEKPVDRDR